VAGALRSDGFTVGSVTQMPAPGKPAETVTRYHPGSLAEANAVLARLSGSVMRAADQSVPAGRVALDVGSDVAVGPPSPPATATPAPPVRVPSPTPPQASDSITPAHFAAQSYDPTACPGPGQVSR